MRIQYFMVEGLNGRPKQELYFHEDINVITGVNGSGKTTILKLMWYMISGNLERIMPEISFSKAQIITDEFTLTIDRLVENKRGSGDLRFTLLIKGHEEISFIDRSSPYSKAVALKLPIDKKDETNINDIDEINSEIAIISRSAFFPTFRRIEGGFGQSKLHPSDDYSRLNPELSTLRDSVNKVSSRLSVFDHLFVTSMSLDDIVNSLTAKYAAASREIDEAIKLSHSKIRNTINDDDIADNDKLLKIRNFVDMEANLRKEKLRSFDALSHASKLVFRRKSIRLSDFLFIGSGEDRPISVDHLSAGEKQMISFLFYNAFIEDGIIFIDEPELSLHNDWQRILFTALMSQRTNNQFFVATHSPTIYSKFSDKEINLK